MAEKEAAATPPANNGGIDYDKLAAAVTTAVSAHVKPLHDRLAAIEERDKSGKEKEKEESARGVTLEQVGKLLDDKLTAQQAGQQQRQQRDQYLGEKLKDLPAAYRNQLGNDQSKWAAEEQTIRSQFKADRQALGVTVDDKGGAVTTAGAKPGGAVDYSKLSPTQKIEQGLKNSKPAANVATAATGEKA